ncbi:TetR/AcrR family transcriptional regulator [Actinomadura flavalba]|uniref:TetR/AcrR family transcriptional regulator n=1 Tax=Actinomadura flavalba TaxID=1120938 RepID=UPI0003688EB6|nr:TetR/AcrR family transcriptional regulator [Actinomadura flavalba]
MTSHDDPGPAPRRPRGRPPGGGHTPVQARDKLLDAAAESFRTAGITATTMTGIARRAGFTRAVIYRHFSGRDDVVDALTRRTLDRHLATIAVRFAELDDPAEIIVGSLVFIATEVGTDPLLALLSEHRGRHTVVHLIESSPEIGELVLSMYAAGLKRFGRRGLRPGLDAHDGARFIVSTALAFLLDAVPGVRGPEQVRRYVVSFVLPGLMADPPPVLPLDP